MRKSFIRETESKYQDKKWRTRPLFCSLPFREWLCDQGSLTARIRQRCDAFRVQAIGQGLAQAFADEREALGLKSKQLGIVREVHLYCGEKAVVFAHSALTRNGLRKSWRLISSLGNRSLGQALFTNPRITRLPLRYKKLTMRDPLLRRAHEYLPDKPKQLWARRSIYLLKGEPLLVTEIFLPRIVALKK